MKLKKVNTRTLILSLYSCNQQLEKDFLKITQLHIKNNQIPRNKSNERYTRPLQRKL